MQHPIQTDIFSVQCPLRSKNKTNYGQHFHLYHGAKFRDTCDKIEQKNIQELRQLKINFNRLELLYKEALTDAEKNKAENEMKILKLQSEYDRVFSQNIVLEEKHDILYKLAKSYLENNSKSSSEDLNEASGSNPSHRDEKEVEVVENRGENNAKEAWNINKLRGFKRKKSTPTHSTNHIQSVEEPVVHENNDEPPTVSPKSTGQNSGQDQPTNSERYCHYFVNKGHCNYEARSGNKCKYLHKTAPLCKFGVNCSTQKCMFSHPRTKPDQRSPWNQSATNFLDQRNLQSMTNPWLALNPWALPMHNVNWQMTHPIRN